MKVNLVMFAGSRNCDDETRRAMESLGEKLDKDKYHLWYGGGDAGLMGVLPKAYHDRGGEVSCVDWRHFQTKFGKPSWMEESQIDVKETFPDRQLGLLEKGDVFLCLPGGVGTLSELLDVITFNSVKHFKKRPIIIFNREGYYDSLKSMIESMVSTGYINDLEDLNITFADSIDEIQTLID